MGDSKETIKKQLLSFREFHEEAKEFSEQVDELVSSASETEAVITGFRSDLVKKTDSLKAVWDKFLQRVQNRGTVLTMAHTFHTSTEQVRVQELRYKSPSLEWLVCCDRSWHSILSKHIPGHVSPLYFVLYFCRFVIELCT